MFEHASIDAQPWGVPSCALPMTHARMQRGVRGFAVFVVVFGVVFTPVMRAAERERTPYDPSHPPAHHYRKQITVSSEAFQKQRRERVERQKKIAHIVADFRDKKIPRAEAEQQLHPLIKLELQEELDTMDQQTAYLHDQLAELTQLKNHPTSVRQTSQTEFQNVDYRIAYLHDQLAELVQLKKDPGPVIQKRIHQLLGVEP